MQTHPLNSVAEDMDEEPILYGMSSRCISGRVL
jgi:hypothetical protein